MGNQYGFPASKSSSGTVTAVTGVAPIVSSGGNTPAISVGKASASAFGVVEVDGTTITASGGVISAVGGGSYAGPATQSVQSSATRAYGTVYQNTTGKPMWVNASSYSSPGVETGLTAYSDSSSNPGTYITSSTTNAGSIGGDSVAAVMFVVLPGNYYKVIVAGTATFNSWVEWY